MLSGILYFHPISDSRMPARHPLANHIILEKLCGKDALRKVILTTTMWDKVDENLGWEREKELHAYWKTMLDHDPKTFRYYNTPQSAWDIVDHFFHTTDNQHTVLLAETDNDQASPSTLETVEAQQEILQKIYSETRRHPDSHVLMALKEDYDEIRGQLASSKAKKQGLLFRSLLRHFTSVRPNTRETLRARSFESTTSLPETVVSTGVTDIVQIIPNSPPSSLQPSRSSTLVETGSIYSFCSQTTISTCVGRFMRLRANPSPGSSVETFN
jgi:hypothetical protein